MNDATLWNSGKTARQDCFSVPFIHIQGIFYSWRDFGVYLSVYFSRPLCCARCPRIKAGSSASQITIGSYSHGLCFSPDNVSSVRCIYIKLYRCLGTTAAFKCSTLAPFSSKGKFRSQCLRHKVYKTDTCDQHYVVASLLHQVVAPKARTGKKPSHHSSIQ